MYMFRAYLRCNRWQLTNKSLQTYNHRYVYYIEARKDNRPPYWTVPSYQVDKMHINWWEKFAEVPVTILWKKFYVLTAQNQGYRKNTKSCLAEACLIQYLFEYCHRRSMVRAQIFRIFTMNSYQELMATNENNNFYKKFLIWFGLFIMVLHQIVPFPIFWNVPPCNTHVNNLYMFSKISCSYMTFLINKRCSRWQELIEFSYLNIPDTRDIVCCQLFRLQSHFYYVTDYFYVIQRMRMAV